MERWLAALERRFGRHLPGNFTYWLVGLMGLTFVMGRLAPGFTDVLALDPDKVMEGQVWRLVTYLVLPPNDHPVFMVFVLWWYYRMGTTLEADWGAVKYLLWWLIGMIGTTVVAFGLHLPASNGFLLMALFLSYATLYPEERIYVFFVIPVAIKWLAILDAIALVTLVGMLPGLQKLLPVVAIANYLLFFTPALAALLRSYVRRGARAAEGRRFRDAGIDRERVRKCAICGASDADPAVDIRVCSCEKCGKPTEYCLHHARNH